MTKDYTIAPDDDHCCGCCANMEYEDAIGFGWCEIQQTEVYCGDYCGEFKDE